MKFTEEHAYGLDSTGMTILRNGISENLIIKLRKIMEEKLPISSFKGDILSMSEEFFSLIDHPWVMEACVCTLGRGFRFDHAFSISQPGGNENLHGGQFESSRSQYWISGTNGNMWCGQLQAHVCLTSQDENTGGLIYIPGSHKSAWVCHGSKVLREILCNNINSELICVPRLNAGDIMIFPHSLCHGTKNWKGNGRRHTLYYAYYPGSMILEPYSTIEKFLPLAKTELQKRLLRPPYAAINATSSEAVEWRKDTI